MTNSVKFMSSKFYEYEKKRLEREAGIVELESEIVFCLPKLKSCNMQLTEWSNIQDVTQY